MERREWSRELAGEGMKGKGIDSYNRPLTLRKLAAPNNVSVDNGLPALSHISAYFLSCVGVFRGIVNML